MEAWEVVHSGLVADLTVQDVRKPFQPLLVTHLLLMVDPLWPAIGV